MDEIREVIGRRALLAASSNYQSIIEALMELIDNPFDHRNGRRLTIDVWIDKKGDHVQVIDQGGEGMDNSRLQEWIHWGEGSDHQLTDIGQYRIGGKLAAIYLAEELEIICRRTGDRTIWKFHDPHWGSRTETLQTTIVQTRAAALRGWRGDAPDPETGFVRVTLRGLKPHRYEVERLRSRLADAYELLLGRGDCVIRVNGEPVAPAGVPWASDVEIVQITPEMLDVDGRDLRVSGQIGALDRALLPKGRTTQIQPGVKTAFNGRKISDGETFGHNLEMRNTLRRLYGWIDIHGSWLLPNQLKNGWSRDSEAWELLQEFMHMQMRGVVRRLSELADDHTPTQKEQARAERALRQIDRMARGLRRRMEAEGGRTPERYSAAQRFLRATEVWPHVRLDSLGADARRSELRSEEDGAAAVVINTDYPLYQQLGQHQNYFLQVLLEHFVYAGESAPDPRRELIDELLALN